MGGFGLAGEVIGRTVDNGAQLARTGYEVNVGVANYGLDKLQAIGDRLRGRINGDFTRLQ